MVPKVPKTPIHVMTMLYNATFHVHYNIISDLQEYIKINSIEFKFTKIIDISKYYCFLGP